VGTSLRHPLVRFRSIRWYVFPPPAPHWYVSAPPAPRDAAHRVRAAPV